MVAVGFLIIHYNTIGLPCLLNRDYNAWVATGISLWRVINTFLLFSEFAKRLIDWQSSSIDQASISRLDNAFPTGKI
ncbi:MAG: hypothetical protein CM1200mP30_32960 [Pseudomonadota bacterium]|nr:MAG: hypothetical protein CM1200mP30_32960 [Pseudomonadota bacterium]